MQPQKNLLIRNSKDIIRKFKVDGFEFYKANDKNQFYSFKNYLLLILKNLKLDYEKEYKTILIPSDEYLIFYKKKGSNIHQEYVKESKETITFTLYVDDYDLYYNLMHTFFVNNSKNFSNFSTSMYFAELVNNYLPNKSLKFFE